MKISLKQLEQVISKMKYSLLGFNSSEKDLIIDVEMFEENPGEGFMMSGIRIKATKPADPKDANENKETRMEIELYPEDHKQEPRASKIESFKITGNY